jgi:hypothetical protein
VNPTKRWAALAILQPDNHWQLTGPFNVGDLLTFFSSIKSHQRIQGSLLCGFDFPIGLPLAYAKKVGISDFLLVLPELGRGRWENFFYPAQNPHEISEYRPFYPQKPGNSRRSHLELGLDLSFDQLYRLCEKAQINRRAACPLFWTMGGQQVGKAAISGWRDLLLPALNDHQANFKIWPFSGSMAECCLPGNIVIVETYPAEYYSHLQLSFSFSSRKSKRRKYDRQSCADHLLNWAANNRLELVDSLSAAIIDGFGDRPDAEDRFDAVVGLYGMINVILGNRPFQEPVLRNIRNIEGWIFGQ